MTHDALIEMERLYMKTAARVINAPIPRQADIQTLRAIGHYLRERKADWFGEA